MSSFSIPTIASLKNAVDELRVQYYPKNETERRVYEALSSKNWGASTTLLGEIASDSYDYEKYGIIMSVVWEMIDSPGSSWKQIFKALSLLEFLIKNGAERVIEECRDHMRTLRKLQEYNYFEGTADKGSGVREKSKQLIDLLGSNDLIRTERDKAKKLRNKFTGVGSDGSGNSGSYGGYGGSSDSRYDSGRYDSYSGGGRRESYSGGGTDRYRDQDSRESRRASESSSYGGGSYDSDRRGRYTDEPRDTHDSYSNNERSDDNYTSTKSSASASTNKKTSSSSAAASSSGGKFKVNIKSEPATKSAGASSQSSQQVDFFGSSGPAEVFSTPAATFDAFGFSSSSTFANIFTGSNQTHAHHSNDGFDAFQTAPAPSHGGFDTFATHSTHSSNHTFDAFSTPAAPPRQNQFDAFSAPAPQPPPHTFQPQSQNFGNFQSAPQQFDAFASAPSSFVPQQTFTQPQSHGHDDFGDFEGASTSTSTSAQKPADKWASLGGLVNLTDLNSSAPKKETSSSTQPINHSSFAGLDGFSQPRSMNSGPSLSSGMGNGLNSSMNNSRPMGNPMGGSGMGMGAPMGNPMGGPAMGMGAPMGNPMGGPAMGMGAPMGNPMGGPGMGMGAPMAYPPMGGPGMGMGAPMGNPMGGPAMGMGAPMGNPMGGPGMGMGAPMAYPPRGGFPPQGGYPQGSYPPNGQFSGFR